MMLPFRLLADVKPANLFRFVRDGGLRNLAAINRFIRTGEPAFYFLSVTQRCNLSCRGCWAIGADKPVDMDQTLLRRILSRGGFFGILGGEPLLIPNLPELLGEHRNCYFLLFTNGTLIDKPLAERLAKAGNITPLINVAGGSQNAVTICRDAGMVTGAAWSIDKSNFAETVSSACLDRLAELGAHFVWPYIFRPSGVDPNYALALSDEEVTAVRRFLVDERGRNDLVIIDTYWNHKGEPMCPAATGISAHINPAGQIEPCPPVQFSDACYGEESRWLAAFKEQVPKWTQGCPLMDHPKELAELAKNSGARDSSGRNDLFAACAARPVLGCHNHATLPVPEKYFGYRFAKKHWFFGFGAYG